MLHRVWLDGFWLKRVPVVINGTSADGCISVQYSKMASRACGIQICTGASRGCSARAKRRFHVRFRMSPTVEDDLSLCRVDVEDGEYKRIFINSYIGARRVILLCWRRECRGELPSSVWRQLIRKWSFTQAGLSRNLLQ